MSLLSALPKGDALAEPDWAYGHRGILSILWLHALGIPLFGLYMMGAGPTLYLAGGALLAFIAIAAQLPVVRRRHQAAVATCGLMTASALLVHLAGGQTELHFHFFQWNRTIHATPLQAQTSAPGTETSQHVRD